MVTATGKEGFTGVWATRKGRKYLSTRLNVLGVQHRSLRKIVSSSRFIQSAAYQRAKLRLVRHRELNTYGLSRRVANWVTLHRLDDWFDRWYQPQDIIRYVKGTVKGRGTGVRPLAPNNNRFVKNNYATEWRQKRYYQAIKNVFILPVPPDTNEIQFHFVFRVPLSFKPQTSKGWMMIQMVFRMSSEVRWQRCAK